LIDAGDAQQLARAVSAVIEQPQLREEAREINQAVVDQRAARKVVSASAEAFYETVLRNWN
jgi:UDP:flavonoid glycosyltransferase YjiC (YdhE family)